MKLRARKLKIILGGDAFAYRRTLLGGLSWLFEVVDGICVADGEPVVKSLAEGVPLENIPNMVWFDGQKVHSPDNIQMHDFSHGSTHVFSMPTLADYLSPKLVIPVETARGCPWGKCAFCTHPFGSFAGKNCYNQKPIEIVKRELEFHIEMGFCDFFFVDEAIMPERLKKLSQIISEMKKEISWICYSRLDRHHSSEIFSIARKAGCKKIFWGLETGSERLLKLFRKGISPHLARNILLEAAQAKIASHLFLIGGFPDETDLDRTATLELIDSILPHIDPLSFTYDLFFLRCEIGTEFYNSPEKFGAQKVIHEDENDLAYQFDCVQNIQSKRTFENFQEEIARRVNRAFGNKFGLQNLHLSQDSLHLLLINSNRSLL